LKIIFLVLVILISIVAFDKNIPPIQLLSLYAFLVIFPLILLYLRKNLINGLLLWFILVMFWRLWTVNIPLIPDLPPQRIVWLAISFFFLTDVAFKKRKLVAGGIKIEIVMLLLCLYTLCSGFIAGTLYIEGQGLQLRPLLTAFFIPFSIFFLAKNIIDDEQKIRKTFMFFTVIGLYLGLTGIFEHFKLDYLVFPRYIMNPFVGIHFGQARGPFLQAGVNGLSIGMMFFIPFYLLLHKNNKWTKFLLVISIFCILTGLLFTYNRASWIGFFFASLLIPIFFPNTRKMFTLSVLVLIIVVSFTAFIGRDQISEENKGETGTSEMRYKTLNLKEAVMHRFTSKGSIYSRMNVQKAALKMILEKPVFGFGYHTFKDVSPKYYQRIKGVPYTIGGGGVAAHNVFLFILAELGLVGLILYVFIIFYMLNISRKLYHLLPREGFLGKGLIVIIGGVFIVFFFGMLAREIHYMVFPNGIFFLLFGVLSGLYQRLQLDNSKIIKKPDDS